MEIIKRKTAEDIEALLRILAGWERQKLALQMLERQEAERERKLHQQPGPGHASGLCISYEWTISSVRPAHYPINLSGVGE